MAAEPGGVADRCASGASCLASPLQLLSLLRPPSSSSSSSTAPQQPLPIPVAVPCPAQQRPSPCRCLAAARGNAASTHSSSSNNNTRTAAESFVAPTRHPPETSSLVAAVWRLETARGREPFTYQPPPTHPAMNSRYLNTLDTLSPPPSAGVCCACTCPAPASNSCFAVSPTQCVVFLLSFPVACWHQQQPTMLSSLDPASGSNALPAYPPLARFGVTQPVPIMVCVFPAQPSPLCSCCVQLRSPLGALSLHLLLMQRLQRRLCVTDQGKCCIPAKLGAQVVQSGMQGGCGLS